MAREEDEPQVVILAECVHIHLADPGATEQLGTAIRLLRKIVIKEAQEMSLSQRLLAEVTAAKAGVDSLLALVRGWQEQNLITDEQAAEIESTIAAQRAEVDAALLANTPAPKITSISPTSATAGAADTSISISGSGFRASCVVNADGQPLATTYGASTSLTAVLPAALLAAAGAISITVADGAQASNAAIFNVN